MGRLVKLSRDVTIEAKRIIFLLHRISLEDVEDFRGTEGNTAILDEAETRLPEVETNLWKLVGSELRGEDPWFYLRAYTAGLQEYVEALSFYHHLRFGKLVTWQQVTSATNSKVNQPCQPKKVHVESKEEEDVEESKTEAEEGGKGGEEACEEKDVQGEDGCDSKVLVPRADYMLGVADLTGEVMRQAVNSAGAGNARMCFNLLNFLQEIHDGFVALPDSHREVPRKLGVLQSSLRKVENVCYNINVRGTEVPKHLLGTYMEPSGNRQPQVPREYDQREEADDY